MVEIKRKLYINASNVADVIGFSNFKTRDEIYQKKDSFQFIETDSEINNKLQYAFETQSIDECNNIEKNIINECIIKSPNIDHNIIEKNIEQTININRGILNESKIIDKFEETQKIPVKIINKLYYLNFNFKEINLKIGGKVDGIDELNNKILEIKNRRYKFLGIRDYEKVQLEIYMKMLNFTKATLIERYDKEDKIHEYNHDPKLYNKIIDGLRDYVEYIDKKYPQ